MSVKILGVTVGLPVVAVATYLIAKNLDKKPSKPKIVVPTTTMPTAVPTSVPTYSMDTIAPKGYDNMRKPLISPSAQKAIDDELARRAREKAEKERAEAARKAAIEAGINPIKMMSLTVDLGRVNEQDINLINSLLTNPDGYDMTYTLKGHTVWNATYVPRNMKISSVGMNIPSNTSKRLKVWAHVNNPNQPHFDFNARNRRDKDKESLISGGVYQVRDGRGKLGNTTAAILEFTFADGRKLRLSMAHQEVKVTDKYGGSGKMSIQHYYGPNVNNFARDNNVWIKFPDGTSRKLQ